MAGVFTKSKCASAPVEWCRAQLTRGTARALVVNSGNANAFTGKSGRVATKLTADIAAAVKEHEPDAVRIAAPELGAVALAAAASLASRLPFLIVRKQAKGYGTSNKLEGISESGELVCLVEDVVTSGGAALQAVEAVREAGLVCRTAVCVVDREEGGSDELARHGVRLWPLFRASELQKVAKSAANPHG